jgi:hypothetical protein
MQAGMRHLAAILPALVLPAPRLVVGALLAGHRLFLLARRRGRQAGR